MSMLRTWRHEDFDPARLAAAKGTTTVSVCIPARNEASTVGLIVERIVAELAEPLGLVDEVVVIDDHSDDGTAAAAEAAGAHVLAASDVLCGYGDSHGKGEALWKSLFACRGDIVVWCDADLVEFHSGFITGILGPLLSDPDLVFVKGFYQRPLRDGDGGGRVTELVARPVISLLFPELAPVVQPLAGEYGGRREALEQLPFIEGYGVDLGLVIDVARRFGLDAMAQVDLGVRLHRNRTLDELGPQALAVLAAALGRAEPALIPEIATLVRPGAEAHEVRLAERPALRDVPEYARRSA